MMLNNIYYYYGLLLSCMLPVCTGTSTASKPHIIKILADDLGWANVGFKRLNNPSREVVTPNLDALVVEGIELDQFYVFKYCSPTRSALQTGRNPIHVNVVNPAPTTFNPDDLQSGYAGIPLGMTSIAEKMALGGYTPHMVGKWDAGMATPRHSPIGRGYESWIGYFGHCNDYWTEIDKCGSQYCPSSVDVAARRRHHRHHEGKQVEMVDLWDGAGPAHGRNGSITCSQENQSGCVYEDAIFHQRVMDIVTRFVEPSAGPLFLVWAPHIVHGPREVPKAWFDKFPFIDDHGRRLYAAAVSYLDDMVGQVVNLLKSRDMWNNTLIVFVSDNGGDNEGNNWPLRGMKFSNWQGGIRSVAFVSGGYVPSRARGTKLSGLAAIEDIYATFCGIAGVDPTDYAAKSAGLPPIDGVNQWPYWSATVPSSPRRVVPIGEALGSAHGTGKTQWGTSFPTNVAGVIDGDLKLLTGTVEEAFWTGPVFPNKTGPAVNISTAVHCGGDGSSPGGCLFNITADPTEHYNLANERPADVERLWRLVRSINNTVFSPNRGDVDPRACTQALTVYGGFWGPWLNLSTTL